jgi:hypothetical protein
MQTTNTIESLKSLLYTINTFKTQYTPSNRKVGNVENKTKISTPYIKENLIKQINLTIPTLKKSTNIKRFKI